MFDSQCLPCFHHTIHLYVSGPRYIISVKDSPGSFPSSWPISSYNRTYFVFGLVFGTSCSLTPRQLTALCCSFEIIKALPLIHFAIPAHCRLRMDCLCPEQCSLLPCSCPFLLLKTYFSENMPNNSKWCNHLTGCFCHTVSSSEISYHDIRVQCNNTETGFGAFGRSFSKLSFYCP